MGRTRYWRGSTSPVWHMGLQRFLDWGDAADTDDLDTSDERWTTKDPDPKDTREHDPDAKDGATAADSAPPVEDPKNAAGKAGAHDSDKEAKNS